MTDNDFNPVVEIQAEVQVTPTLELQAEVDMGSLASERNAEAWAVGQRGGVDVSSTDQTYHNNAKYWAEQAEQTVVGSIIDDTSTALNKVWSAHKVSEEFAETNGEVSALKSAIQEIDEFIGFDEINEVSFSSWAQDVSSASIPSNSPFVLKFDSFDYSGSLVTKIKAKVYTAGTLTLGVIKKSTVVNLDPVDLSYATVKATLNIQNTGEQVIEMPEPFEVGSDEYIFITVPTDSCKFLYNGSGSQKGFYYTTSNGTRWTESSNALGIDVYVTKTIRPSNVRELVNSVYHGKTLSILGDSISTYSGYIPEGNATYYPAGTVQDVTDTWWKKLVDALGMTINVNNSWSGSRVTTTNGETSAGCMTRCQSLGTNPDVIIVWMGINDFNNNVALGSYDGSSAIPADTTTFREAYGIMLNKILTAYPSSEVWVCTLPQCERNGDSGFPEINGNGVALIQFNKAIIELAEAFGVKVLNHNKSGLTYQNMPTFNPDNLHPNKYGHSLIANNDIREMDGTISMRYPISN